MGRDWDDVVMCDPKYFSKAAILRGPEQRDHSAPLLIY